MAEQKLSPDGRVVLGFLLLGVALLAVALMSRFPMDVSGRDVPPDDALGVVGLAGGLLTLVATVAFASRRLGREGWRLLGREIGAGLFAGGIAGVLAGFVLRAVFGPAAVVMLFLAYGAVAYFVIWYSKRDGETAG